MGCRSVLFGLRSGNSVGISRDQLRNSTWGSTRCKIVALPRVQCGHVGKLEPRKRGSWSLGSGEAALCSRGVSIRVPPTALSAIGPDLAQQPEHGSQPRRPTYWADLPGPVHLVLACPEPLSSASGHLQHSSPHVPTIPLSPRLQRASEPHLITAAGAAIAHHLLCYYIRSFLICHSSGSWPGPRGA